jgi:O-antigen ligase
VKYFEKYTFIFAGFLIVISWLLPNHYRPWTTFHSDAVMALAFCILLPVMFWTYRAQSMQLNELHFLFLLLSIISIGYRVLNVVPYWAQVVIPALYIFGYLQVVVAGQLLQRNSAHLLDALVFLAPLIAAFISVGIQLAQWLWIPEYGITDIWISQSDGVRPAANLNQPNQLASLLLWGVISAMWLYRKKHIGILGLAVLGVYLGLGVGLTLSRTALISFFLVSLWLLIVNKKIVGWRHFAVWGAVASAIFVAWSTHAFLPRLLNIPINSLGDIVALGRDKGIRLEIWRMFISAILKDPFFGYGPQMTLSAQFSQMHDFSNLGEALYSSAHNIALDLMVWYGIPVAVLLLLFLVHWFAFVLNKVSGAPENNMDLYVSMLLVMFVHANLELPLHHAYFLLPVGMIVGALMSRGRFILRSVPFELPIKVFLWPAFLSMLCLALVVGEYMKIERQVEFYRLRQANILNTPKIMIPSVVILDQLSDQLWFAMLDERSEMSQDDLSRAGKYVESYKYCDVIRKYKILLDSNRIYQKSSDLSLQISRNCAK